MSTDPNDLESLVNRRYEHGFVTDIESETLPPGLNEDVIRAISARKKEPEFMLDWRLKAFRMWEKMETPDWAKLEIPMIDYQDAYYYAEPKAKEKLGSLDEVDPEILRVYEKLGIYDLMHFLVVWLGEQHSPEQSL